MARKPSSMSELQHFFQTVPLVENCSLSFFHISVNIINIVTVMNAHLKHTVSFASRLYKPLLLIWCFVARLPFSIRWCRRERCTASSGCTGPRRFWSGRVRPRRRSPSPCTWTIATSWTAKTLTALSVRAQIKSPSERLWSHPNNPNSNPTMFPTCRLYVVYLWNPRPGLGGEAHLRKDPLHELQRLPSEV